jgi:hypothetical protein
MPGRARETDDGAMNETHPPLANSHHRYRGLAARWLTVDLDIIAEIDPATEGA